MAAGGTVPSPRIIRFEPFELDVRTAELRKHGIKIRLHAQPFRILLMLLNRQGDVVLREQIRQALWPNNTVVEFDHGINAAIQRLRDALGDSADNPRFVETLHRRGYRFIGAVEPAAPPSPDEVPAQLPSDLSDLTGVTFSHFRLIEKLGAGGMGVVYRAEDLKLGRHVALKFLPLSAEEASPQMLARFQREARAASALSHPNICTIYGVEEFAGQPVIVMELVEGETLAARLIKAALPPERALSLAIQLAAALDAAHRKRIVHRDLKPANIMLARSGIKVLDFGLARMDRAMPESDEIATKVTKAGAILGTWQYMSPEQAQGKDADARSDIFSFGCVLLEMLTGKCAFSGDSAADVISAILTKDPLAEAVSLPPSLAGIVRHCLEKNPEDRFQSARDLAFALQSLQGPSVSLAKAGGLAPSFVRLSWLPWASAASCLAIAAVFALLWLRQPRLEVSTAVFPIEPPANGQFEDMYDYAEISPDGRFVVLGVKTVPARSTLWLRPLDSTEARPLAGTEGGHNPFWSPDGKSLAFFGGGQLKRIDIAGGPVTVLCPSDGPGGSWGVDGVILVPGPDGLRRVPASGGTPAAVTEIDRSRRESGHWFPQFLPGGKRFIYQVVGTDANQRGIYASSLADPKERKRLLPTDLRAVYAPPRNGSPGALLWLRGQTLMAQPFDTTSLRLVGDPTPVATNVARNSIRGAFWASDAGTLAYHTGAVCDRARLVWVSRDGTRLEEAGPEDRYGMMALSPDGKRLVIARNDAADNEDIWLYELSRKVMTRLTFDPARDYAPIWSPDGRQIAFASDRSGATQIYRKSADGGGPEEQLTRDPYSKYPTDWTRDRRFLVYNQNSGKTNWDIFMLPLEGDRNPIAVLLNSWGEGGGILSPDEKWIAYISEEAGTMQVFIRAFSRANSSAGGKSQVSAKLGWVPLWRGDGKELFYTFPSGNESKFMAAGIRVGSGGIEVETPRELFSAAILHTRVRAWAVTPDGQRFLIEETPPVTVSPLTVVLNWQAGLKK